MDGTQNINSESVTVSAPKLRTAEFTIVGTAPLVILRFDLKGGAMREAQAAGSTSKSKKKREAKDFDGLYEKAKYVSAEGWNGFHAASIRNAMIRACSLINFKMTIAKMSIFTKADGFDKSDGTPLVRVYGTWEKVESTVRNANGSADIRVRAMCREWSAKLRLEWDEDQFTLQDISNLLLRAGAQVGIGEGRPGSKNSAGVGWGTSEIKKEGSK